MSYELDPDAGAVEGPSYRPMHDYRHVDVDAWAQQWFSGLAGVDSSSREYRAMANCVGAQLGLHPAVREVDVDDLDFMMGLLRMIGEQNPYVADPDPKADRRSHEDWARSIYLAMMFGRQVVRNTLSDAERYAAFRIEQERAGADYLTGVPNRRGLVRYLRDRYGIVEGQVRHNASGEQLPPAQITHIYCDANRFKWINDNLGHHVGDAAIQEVAWEMQDLFRKSESSIVYRYGGDEFGVILGGLDDLKVSKIVERTTDRQIRKLVGDRYRTTMAAISRRIKEVKSCGVPLRAEALKPEFVHGQPTSGRHPYHKIFINGVVVGELRDIITLAIGVKSGEASHLDDVEALRRGAEDAMRGAKQVFRGILCNTERIREPGSDLESDS